MLHLTCVCHQLAVARTNEEMFKTKLVREDARYVELNRLLTQAYTKVIAAGLNPAGMSGAPWCAWRESQGWLKLLFFKESWAELVLRLTYGKTILWSLIGWNRRPSYSKQGSPNGTDVIQIRHFCDHSRFICSLSNLNNHPPLSHDSKYVIPFIPSLCPSTPVLLLLLMFLDWHITGRLSTLPTQQPFGDYCNSEIKGSRC